MSSSNSTTIAVIVMGLATIAAIAYGASSVKAAIDEAAAKPPPPAAKRAIYIDLAGNCPNGGCEQVAALCNKWGYPAGEVILTNNTVPKGMVCFDEAYKP